MIRTPLRVDDFGSDYALALRRYLLRKGEASLHHAYELGRRGLAQGLGVLDMVNLYHQALTGLLDARSSPELQIKIVRMAGEFFAESMSPFEMTHRAIGEANSTLRRLNETLEEEVRRIAHALHDEAGQLLVAVYIALGEAARDLPRESQKKLQEVERLLDQAGDRIRLLSHELRPTILDNIGLIPAVEFLAQSVSQRTGLRIKVESESKQRLPPRLGIALYRIVQEALTNIQRHARAKSVRIRFRISGEKVMCSVVDDGIGFDPELVARSRRRGLGLLGVQERLQAVGGELRIESAHGNGAKLEISVPLEVEDANSNSSRR
jgi:signal transduction histidine kinase